MEYVGETGNCFHRHLIESEKSDIDSIDWRLPKEK